MKFFFKLFFLSSIFLIGCSSSQDCGKQEKEIIGISSIVGNEPFTEVAIITDNNDIYIIKEPLNIKNVLSGTQGNYYKVKYKALKDSAGVHIIIPTEINKQ